MELFTPESIKTLAGASAAVAVVIAVAKKFIGFSGRATQALTAVLGVGISLLAAHPQTLDAVVLAVFNGFVIASVATAADNYVNYGKDK